MPMRISAWINLKGGVGKSTSVINLAYALVRLGFNVLLVDADAQENATDMLLGEDNPAITLTLYDFMTDMRNVPFSKIILNYAGPDAQRLSLRTRGRLDIAPGDDRLGFVSDGFAKNRLGQPAANVWDTLALGLSQVDDRYDFCLIDPGPMWGPINDAVVKAAHGVVVPFMPAAMTSLSFKRLLKQLGDANQRIANQGNQTKIYGVLWTMCHLPVQQSIAALLKHSFKKKGIYSFSPVINFTMPMLKMVEERVPIGAYYQEHPEIVGDPELSFMEATALGVMRPMDIEAIDILAQEFIAVARQ